VLGVVSEQVERVHRTTGLSLAQILQGEDDLIVISAWRTAKDLRAYASSLKTSLSGSHRCWSRRRK
jgi:hypothetical protein